MTALPIAMPPTAVDNDDEWTGVSPPMAFRLGCEFERVSWQLRTFAGGRKQTATLDVYPQNVARVCALIRSLGFFYETKSNASCETRILVRRRST